MRNRSLPGFVVATIVAAASAASARPVAYVANFNGNTVSVVDLTTHQVTATVPVGISPRDVVVQPDGTRAYVVNALSGTVSVIDTASNLVTKTIPVGGILGRAAIGPLLSIRGAAPLIVTRPLNNDLVLIDTEIDAVGTTAPTDAYPDQVVVEVVGAGLWVTNNVSGTVR